MLQDNANHGALVIPNESYFTHPFVSHSRLVELDLDTKDEDYRGDFTKAFRRGNIVDAYATQPSNIAYYNPSPEEHAIGVSCRGFLYADTFCRMIIGQSIFQSPFYNPDTKFVWNGVQFTLDTKRLYDGWIPGTKWGWDLKTTSATTPRAFREQCEYLCYWRSRAWYMKGSNAQRDLIIGINPETGSIFKEFIQFGDDKHKTGIAQYSELAYKYWILKD